MRIVALVLLGGGAALLWRTGQSYLRAERLLDDAESSIALGNPLSAAEGARAGRDEHTGAGGLI